MTTALAPRPAFMASPSLRSSGAGTPGGPAETSPLSHLDPALPWLTHAIESLLGRSQADEFYFKAEQTETSTFEVQSNHFTDLSPNPTSTHEASRRAPVARREANPGGQLPPATQRATTETQKQLTAVASEVTPHGHRITRLSVHVSQRTEKHATQAVESPPREELAPLQGAWDRLQRRRRSGRP